MVDGCDDRSFHLLRNLMDVGEVARILVFGHANMKPLSQYCRKTFLVSHKRGVRVSQKQAERSTDSPYKN
jgi:hypothetical protein